MIKILPAFALSFGICLAQDGATSGDSLTYPALGDGGFTIGAPIGDQGAVHYAHTARESLAVNSNQFPGEFARSFVDFTGVTNTYNITLSTWAENDGQSTFIFYVNGEEKGRQTNPVTTETYSDETLTLAQNLEVPAGARLSVESNSITNGATNNTGAVSFSRGRFRGLTLTATKDAGPETPPLTYTPFEKQIPSNNLQAEDYDEVVESSPATFSDNTYRDTSADGVEMMNVTVGGQDEVIVSVTKGESLGYLVNVSTEGVYELAFQVSTKNQSSAFRLFQDDVDLTDSDIAVTVSESLRDFQTIVVSGVHLSQGQSTFRVQNVRGFFNFNSFDVTLIEPAIVPPPTGEAIVGGELRKWHKVTLSWQGPEVSEFDGLTTAELPLNDGHSTEGQDATKPNPFTDYRLDVTFTHESGSPVYVVPGYFAAETYALDATGHLSSENAADSLASSGDVWRVNFAPDKVGTWNYVTSFLTGAEIAAADPDELSTGVPVSSIHGKTGSFTVLATNKTGRDFRGKGRLQYVNKHHLQFAETKEFFMKAGVDSPENLLNYEDFDGQPTFRNKSWEAHASNYVAAEASNYTWGDDESGKNLLGALRYLADQGLNAFSFLTFSVDGDDGTVFPHIFRGDNDEYQRVLRTKGDSDANGNSLQEFAWLKPDLIYHQRFDVSKMAQWENIFAYGQELGLFLHFKHFEKENDKLMDGNGDLGIQRRLYYRELVARFGHHLALNWNLGEESQNSTAQLMDFAGWFTENDPYDHHVVVHTPGSNGAQEGTYDPLLNNSDLLTGASLQTRVPNFLNVYASTLRWVQGSAGDNPWVVTTDEPGAADLGLLQDDADENWKDARIDALWGNIIAGGGGVEFYFGSPMPNDRVSDLRGGDFTEREGFWPFCRNASAFFENYDVQFQEMSNDNSKVFSSETFTLTDPDDAVALAANDNVSARSLVNAGSEYVILLRRGGTVDLDLSGVEGSFDVRWYNPRNTTPEGPSLEIGDVSTVMGGGAVQLGSAPIIDDFTQHGDDWIIYVRRSEASTPNLPPTDSFDADNDGQSNQFEFAFGLDPTDGIYQKVLNFTAQSVAGGEFTYTRHDPALTGFRYDVMTSSNLIDWTVDETAIESVETQGDVQTVTVSSTKIQEEGSKVFVRIRVIE